MGFKLIRVERSGRNIWATFRNLYTYPRSLDLIGVTFNNNNLYAEYSKDESPCPNPGESITLRIILHKNYEEFSDRDSIKIYRNKVTIGTYDETKKLKIPINGPEISNEIDLEQYSSLKRNNFIEF